MKFQKSNATKASLARAEKNYSEMKIEHDKIFVYYLWLKNLKDQMTMKDEH